MTISERLLSEIEAGNPDAITAVKGILDSIALVTVADHLVDPMVAALKESRRRENEAIDAAAADAANTERWEADLRANAARWDDITEEEAATAPLSDLPEAAIYAATEFGEMDCESYADKLNREAYEREYAEANKGRKP